MLPPSLLLCCEPEGTVLVSATEFLALCLALLMFAGYLLM